MGNTPRAGNGMRYKDVLQLLQGRRPRIALKNDRAFDDLTLFARVAALGTLSAVAREREVPVSQVARALSRIKKACGSRLTRHQLRG